MLLRNINARHLPLKGKAKLAVTHYETGTPGLTHEGKTFAIGSTIVDPSTRACALAQDDKLLHYCVILSEASACFASRIKFCSTAEFYGFDFFITASFFIPVSF